MDNLALWIIWHYGFNVIIMEEAKESGKSSPSNNSNNTRAENKAHAGANAGAHASHVKSKEQALKEQSKKQLKDLKEPNEDHRKGNKDESIKHSKSSAEISATMSDSVKASKSSNGSSADSSASMNYGILALLVGLLLVAGYSAYTTFGIFNIASGKTAVGNATIPKITVSIIKPLSCTDCYAMASEIQKVSSLKADINVENITYPSEKSKDLIHRYGIQKIPAIVITGDVDKIRVSEFRQAGDGAVFDNPKPVYINAQTGSAVGRVSAIILTVNASDCKSCYDPSSTLAEIETSGVIISSRRSVLLNTAEGQQLVAKYNISHIPAIILSPDADEYQFIKEKWELAGSRESDNYLVQRRVLPPYYDVKKGIVAGIVNVMYISDKACDDCYSVAIHKDILKRFGVSIGSESNIDISEQAGKDLIQKYNITKVPTVVLSSDAAAYDAFVLVWAQVGSIENDGAFVFRQPSALQGAKYVDLTSSANASKASADVSNSSSAGK